MFFYKKGSVNKLVLEFEGGGACWSWATCQQTFGLHDMHADIGLSEDVNSRHITSVEQITDRYT